MHGLLARRRIAGAQSLRHNFLAVVGNEVPSRWPPNGGVFWLSFPWHGIGGRRLPLQEVNQNGVSVRHRDTQFLAGGSVAPAHASALARDMAELPEGLCSRETFVRQLKHLAALPLLQTA
jgi:hypothetical protein